MFRMSHVVPSTLLVIFLYFCPLIAFSQTYNARTDLAPQSYPASIPCPSAGGCSGGGALIGAGHCFTPNDFSTQLCRVTDNNSPGTQKDFGTDCGGSSETNVMDVTDTRFYTCTGGGVPVVFSFDGTTSPPTMAPLYNAMLGGCSAEATYTQNLFFSFTRPKVAYSESFSGGNPAICSYDFSSESVIPTRSNGRISVLVDLSTCVSALTGKGYGTAYTEDLTVSADDQTFAVNGSTTIGQGGSGDVYVIIWNRTSGCRVWNTSTGAVTGSWGPTGIVTKPDRFVIHNVRLSKSGDYVKVTTNACLGGGCTEYTNTYIWQISTLNVFRGINDFSAGCGHSSIGYAIWTNNCATGGRNTNFLVRPNTSDDAPGVQTLVTFPSPLSGQDSHSSMNSGNPSDTAPVFHSLYTNDHTTSNAWDNEIIAVTLDGTAKAFRFAHTYITGLDVQNFDARYAIGNVSQDGKYYFWSTDWKGMLGQIGGSSPACTIGKDCRADVFVAILPLATDMRPQPPTGLRVGVE
jgi:hypothetical protein